MYPYHRCPICSRPALDTQPDAGTHCYTINYECGTRIDYSNNGQGYDISQRCDEPKKPSLEDSFKTIKPVILLDTTIPNTSKNIVNVVFDIENMLKDSDCKNFKILIQGI